MKYFLDTEFIEGPQKKRFLGFNVGYTKPTIDLISIGIVAEDGRGYYAISKDFNLKEAWYRFDIAEQTSFEKYHQFSGRKVYWIRENVLKPIFYELSGKDIAFHDLNTSFTFDNLERLLCRYGKTNKEIAEEIKSFVYKTSQINNPDTIANWDQVKHLFPVEFYADYCSYDWVVFCWLFGKMIDLPKGFPMYCNDIQQIVNTYISKTWKDVELSTWGHEGISLDKLKKHPDYPKQEASKKHHALEDARYDRDLYNFLNKL